jgi:hypothetical protein
LVDNGTEKWRLDMNGVENLLGILVIQMFFLIFGNRKRNKQLALNGGTLGLNQECLEKIKDLLTYIGEELSTMDPRKDIAGEVKGMNRLFRKIEENTERMNKIEEHLYNISGNSNEIRENTKIR